MTTLTAPAAHLLAAAVDRLAGPGADQQIGPVALRGVLLEEAARIHRTNFGDVRVTHDTDTAMNAVGRVVDWHARALTRGELALILGRIGGAR